MELNWNAAAVIAALVFLTNQFWEKRKLSRDLRAGAYARFIGAQSRWWRKAQERDRVWKQLKDEAVEGNRLFPSANELEIKAISRQMGELRDELWEEFSLIQVIAPNKTASSAYTLITALDMDNDAFFYNAEEQEELYRKVPGQDVKKKRSKKRKDRVPNRLGADERTRLLTIFTTNARKDLGRGRLKNLIRYVPRARARRGSISTVKESRPDSALSLENVLDDHRFLYGHSVVVETASEMDGETPRGR